MSTTHLPTDKELILVILACVGLRALRLEPQHRLHAGLVAVEDLVQDHWAQGGVFRVGSLLFTERRQGGHSETATSRHRKVYVKRVGTNNASFSSLLDWRTNFEAIYEYFMADVSFLIAKSSPCEDREHQWIWHLHLFTNWNQITIEMISSGLWEFLLLIIYNINSPWINCVCSETIVIELEHTGEWTHKNR